MEYKVGVYARISVAESTSSIDSTSIINQKDIITDYCNKNSLRIYEYYIDDGYSGGNFDRPAFNRMIKDIKEGLINLVITKDISRLGRDFIGTGNYIYKIFPELNVRYIAILDNYDSLNPSINDDMIPFKAVLNDMYLSDISRKIKSSRHELMRQGLFMGSTVPYGYKRSKNDSRVLEVDEYSSLIVKRIFKLKYNGYSSTYIAKLLTKEHINPPNIYNNRDGSFNGEWTSSTINYILHNPVYLGILIQRKYERLTLKSKKKRLLKSDEWIRIDNHHTPLISEEVFNQINDKKDIIRHKKYDILLKGLIKCHECNKTMIVRNTQSGFIYCCSSYAKSTCLCSMHYFKEDVLNKLASNTLLQLLSMLDIKALFYKVSDKLINDAYFEKELNSLNKKLCDNNELLISLYKDKVNGIIKENDFVMIKKSVDSEINDLIEKQKRLQNQKKALSSNIKKYYGDFIKLNNKDIFFYLIDKITIDHEKVLRMYFRGHK